MTHCSLQQNKQQTGAENAAYFTAGIFTLSATYQLGVTS